MITILTGSIDSGKTTRLLRLFCKFKKGDGIALPKFYLDGQYAGQQIVRLSTGQSVPFSRILPHLPEGWDELIRFGDYSFSTGGIAFGRDIFEAMINSPISPVFIDEIGPLELRGEGFYSSFCTLLTQRKDLYVTVRDCCLMDFLTKFSISQYTLYI